MKWVGGGEAASPRSNLLHSSVGQAWCPLEEDELPLGPSRAVLGGTDKFTVLIKNMIDFPAFGKWRSNMLDWQNEAFLKTCLNR